MEHYEWVIGIAFQTAVILFGGYGLVLRNDWSNKSLEARMQGIQVELKKLAEVITMQAVQTNRIDNLETHLNSIERRVEDLRRGNGLVLKPEG